MPFWFYCVFGPHVNYTALKLNTFDYIQNPFYNIADFLKAIFGNLIGNKSLYLLLMGIIIPFVFFYRDKYKQLLFLLLAIVFPLGLILIFDIIQSYWFLQRQFVWVMPLFAFFLGWTWDVFFLMLRLKK
jgi:hypothetical protein